MPFEPLPEAFHILTAHLQNTHDPAIVDLGSGDGAFGRLLRRSGLQVVELDRSPLATGICPAVRGDALEPPFIPGSLDCLLAGNLMRHLFIQDRSGKFFLAWMKLLKPGGTLFLFEDEPDISATNTRNFKDLQAFLADLMPGQRGPLIGLQFFLQWAEKQMPAQIWHCGLENNLNEPNVEIVAEMLTAFGSNPNPGGMAGKLLDSIHHHGLSYGAYWWASAQAD